jgi:hypothetical protein
MLKKLFSAGLLISLLVGCQGDPDTKDLAHYIQQDLFNLETNFRAAANQYESVKKDNERAQVGIIKTKVLLQLDKYHKGLQSLEPKTGLVLRLNEEGIKRVEKTIEKMSEYRKTLTTRDSHRVPIVRSELDESFRKIDEWKDEIYMLAREKNISLPQSRIKN